jgi:filamentous hemagglutinin
VSGVGAAGRLGCAWAGVVSIRAVASGSGIGNNTNLAGAVIASTASANDNILTTNTLSFSDILNKANYSASTIGGSFSTGGGVAGNALANGMGLLGSLTGPGGDASGTTLSAISAGTINVLADATTGANSLAGLSRTTTSANGSIAPIFNLQQLQNQANDAAVGQAFGQIANNIAGDVLASSGLAENSTEGILLHGAIGALQGQISGGNALAGAAGGAASAEVAGVVDSYLASQGITKDNPATKDEYNQIQQATSQIVGTAIGAAVGAVSGSGAGSGGAAGGQAALSSTAYNYLSHDEASTLDSAKKKLAACNSNGGCTDDQVQQLTGTVSTYTALDASRNAAAEAACSTGGAAACQAAQTGIVNAVDTYLNQPLPAFSLTSYQLSAVSELGKVTSENGATLGTQLGAIQDSTLPGSTVAGAATAVVGGLTVATGIAASGAGAAAVDATAGETAGIAKTVPVELVTPPVTNVPVSLPPPPNTYAVYPAGAGASEGALPAGYTTVSRWVSPEEAAQWIQNQGTAVPAGVGTPLPGTSTTTVYVTTPGAAQPGGTGSIRIDFAVPDASLNPAGNADWNQIYQPVQSTPIYNVKINVPDGVTIPGISK